MTTIHLKLTRDTTPEEKNAILKHPATKWLMAKASESVEYVRLERKRIDKDPRLPPKYSQESAISLALCHARFVRGLASEHAEFLIDKARKGSVTGLQVGDILTIQKEN